MLDMTVLNDPPETPPVIFNLIAVVDSPTSYCPAVRRMQVELGQGADFGTHTMRFEGLVAYESGEVGWKRFKSTGWNNDST
jgi:hypothetical protein